jgi:hypothetical protein
MKSCVGRRIGGRLRDQPWKEDPAMRPALRTQTQCRFTNTLVKNAAGRPSFWSAPKGRRNVRPAAARSWKSCCRSWPRPREGNRPVAAERCRPGHAAPIVVVIRMADRAVAIRAALRADSPYRTATSRDPPGRRFIRRNSGDPLGSRLFGSRIRQTSRKIDIGFGVCVYCK